MLWWTTQNLVITTLLAGIAWCVCRMPRVGPVWRHALWMVVLVKLLTPPLVFWPWSVRDPLGLSDRATSVIPKAGPVAVAAALVQSHMPDREISAPPTPQPYLDTDVEFDPAPDDPVPHDTPRPAFVASSPSSVVHTPPERPAGAAGEPIVRRRVQRLLPWLGGVWIAGGIAVALLQCIRIVRMLRHLRRGKPGDSALLGRVEASARRLGVGAVSVRVLPGIGSPVIWALRRPLLLWPEELPEGISEPAVHGLIVHELAHVKRRDHWIGWLELLAGCLWWWNPLFWYVRHQLRENAELACDAWVVSALPAGRKGRRAYAEALLAVCECASNPFNRINRTAPMPAVGVSTGGRRFLERRLAMILRDRVPLRLPRLGLMSVALIALFTLPAWSQRAPDGAARPGEPSAPSDDGRSLQAYGQAMGMSIDGAGLAGGSPVALPQAAREVLDQWARQQEEARQEAARKIEQARRDTIRELKQLQDRFTKAGQLDEAVAVRDAVRRLQAESGAARGGPPRLRYFGASADPGNLTSYRDKVGQSFYFDVTGATAGTVWGNVIYTDDSALAAAAVHSGVLTPGERGIVKVTLLPGRDSYAGSNSNGVESQPYQQWPGSYIVERADPRFTDAPNFTPGRLHNYWREPRSGGLDGGIAPPGGLPGAGPGSVPLESLPGEPGRPAGGGGPPPGVKDDKLDQTPLGPDSIGNLQQFRDRIGQSFETDLVGSTQGRVWGTDVYSDDSSPAAAAVHAGVLTDGQSGRVKITILPGQENYQGSDHNGVTSDSWPTWGGSFRIEPAANTPKAALQDGLQLK